MVEVVGSSPTLRILFIFTKIYTNMSKQPNSYHILQGDWGSHGWEELGIAEAKDINRVERLKALLEWHKEYTPSAVFRIIIRAK